MESDGQKLDVNLKIWNLCEQIQAAVKHHNLDLKFELSQFDPHENGLIDDATFLNVLNKYQNFINLSNVEIENLTEYFRIRDGRIAYVQFLGVLNKEKEDQNISENAFELKENSLLHVNDLTDKEKRQLCILMLKIAKTIILPLLPYFQDYEMVTQNGGTVTLAQFSRVLHFMKLDLTEKDSMLLLKRYMQNSYTVNYLAFLNHIDALKTYLKEQGSMNIPHNDISIPGNLIDLEMSAPPFANSKLPQSSKNIHNLDKISETMHRIQRYIYENRIRTSEFMAPFDLLNVGRITKPQFLRALDIIGISESKKLKLSQEELEEMMEKYADSNNNIQWKMFTDEIDRVFTEKNLEKQPQLNVESPLKCIRTLPLSGQENWHQQTDSIRDLCEETIRKTQNKIITRRIYLHPFFKNYDKLNKGYCRSNQALQVLLTNAILISDEEFEALKTRYCNDMGFNYLRFLEEIDPIEYAPAKASNSPRKYCQSEENIQPCPPKQTKEDIIQILSKVRRQAAINNVKIIDFLVDYDHHKENQIPKTDFQRGLDNASIKLSLPEVDVVCDIFRSPNRGCYVRYRDFCKTLDEIFVQESCGEKNMLPTPLKHFPCVDCVQCFLNFEERTIASKALQKLAKKPDQISNLQQLFKDFDRENCGTVTQNQFLRVLTVRDMNNMISSREFEIVCKCFGYERGLHIEFDYRSFLNVIDVLHETGQVKRHF